MIMDRLHISHEAVRIDQYRPVIRGYEEEYVCVPKVYATVTFFLADTYALCDIADSVYDGDIEHDDRYYDFYVTVYEWNGEYKLGNCIEYEVNDGYSDDSTTYYIDLTDEEKVTVLKALEDDCIRYFKQSLAEFVTEARAELNEIMAAED
jgi:hypothetical protein